MRGNRVGAWCVLAATAAALTPAVAADRPIAPPRDTSRVAALQGPVSHHAGPPSAVRGWAGTGRAPLGPPVGLVAALAEHSRTAGRDLLAPWRLTAPTRALAEQVHAVPEARLDGLLDSRVVGNMDYDDEHDDVVEVVVRREHVNGKGAGYTSMVSARSGRTGRKIWERSLPGFVQVETYDRGARSSSLLLQHYDVVFGGSPDGGYGYTGTFGLSEVRADGATSWTHSFPIADVDATLGFRAAAHTPGWLWVGNMLPGEAEDILVPRYSVAATLTDSGSLDAVVVDGATGAARELPAQPFDGQLAYAVGSGDLSGDGLGDVIFTYSGTGSSRLGQLSAYRAVDGSEIWRKTPFSDIDRLFDVVPAGDVDGDKRGDLALFGEFAPSYDLAVALVSGRDGTLRWRRDHDGGVLALGDVNSDGRAELAGVSGASSDEPAVTVTAYDGRGATRYRVTKRITQATGGRSAASTVALAGDVDGDRVRDLLYDVRGERGDRYVQAAGVVDGRNGRRVFDLPLSYLPATFVPLFAPVDARGDDIVRLRVEPHYIFPSRVAVLDGRRGSVHWEHSSPAFDPEAVTVRSGRLDPGACVDVVVTTSYHDSDDYLVALSGRSGQALWRETIRADLKPARQPEVLPVRRGRLDCVPPPMVTPAFPARRG